MHSRAECLSELKSAQPDVFILLKKQSCLIIAHGIRKGRMAHLFQNPVLSEVLSVWLATFRETSSQHLELPKCLIVNPWFFFFQWMLCWIKVKYLRYALQATWPYVPWISRMNRAHYSFITPLIGRGGWAHYFFRSSVQESGFDKRKWLFFTQRCWSS